MPETEEKKSTGDLGRLALGTLTAGVGAKDPLATGGLTDPLGADHITAPAPPTDLATAGMGMLTGGLGVTAPPDTTGDPDISRPTVDEAPTPTSHLLKRANDLARRMDPLEDTRGTARKVASAVGGAVTSPYETYKAARSSGDRTKVREATKDILNADIVYEQLAHHGAYDELDRSQLPKWGYRQARVVDDATTGFRAVLYLPTEGALSGSTTEGVMARAIHGGTPPPVLAFRGTDNMEGVKDDANREGVGTFQMSAHHADVQGLLSDAGGKVIAMGHSLGGALAQLCAARFPSSVARVVTFQAPAIAKSERKKVDDHNAANPDEAITSTHYRADGDVVHTAGEALTKGDVYTFHSAGLDNPMDHTQYPLARLNALRGGLVPGIEGDDRLVKVDKGDETVKDTLAARMLEGGRKKLAGVVKRTPLEAYKRLWDSVLQMHEIGMDPTSIDLTIDNDIHVDDDGKARIRKNLAALPSDA